MVAMDAAFSDLSYEYRALNLLDAGLYDAAQVYATLALVNEIMKLRLDTQYG